MGIPAARALTNLGKHEHMGLARSVLATLAAARDSWLTKNSSLQRTTLLGIFCTMDTRVILR
jgi:hypothetical protein